MNRQHRPALACAACMDGPAEHYHHLTGRLAGPDGVRRYLDPELTVGLCKRCHAAVHRMWEACGLARVDGPQSVVERVELRLRRSGGTLGRLRPCDGVYPLLATAAVGWAGELAAFVRALDDALPAWREALGTHPGRPRQSRKD